MVGEGALGASCTAEQGAVFAGPKGLLERAMVPMPPPEGTGTGMAPDPAILKCDYVETRFARP
jgi:hypothetical protein